MSSGKNKELQYELLEGPWCEIQNRRTLVCTNTCMYFTDEENDVLFSPVMTKLYFDYEDADTQLFLANTMLLMIQPSDTDVLGFMLLSFIVCCNTSWLHTDKARYLPKIYRLEKAFTRHSCPLCTHWLRFYPMTLVKQKLGMSLRTTQISKYHG